MDKGTISINGWEKYQHYKHRNPIWIKLYTNLLDDPKWECLQDASKLLAVHLWLLAGRCENKMPFNMAWLSRKVPSKFSVEDIKELEKQGFITVLAGCYQDASEMLCQSRVEKSRVEDFEIFWKEYPKRNTDSKACALKAWKKLGTEIPPLDELLRITRAYSKLDSVKQGYQKGCVAWLNQKGWTMEFATAAPKKNTLLDNIKAEGGYDGV